MRQSDIIDEIKKRNPTVSEETIKLILRSFHNGLRHYLSHPEQSKSGILVNGLMSIYLPPKKIEKYIHNFKFKLIGERTESNKKKQSDEEVLQYYEDLLKNVKSYERKSRTKSDDDGFVGRISVELSETKTD